MASSSPDRQIACQQHPCLSIRQAHPLPDGARGSLQEGVSMATAPPLAAHNTTPGLLSPQDLDKGSHGSAAGALGLQAVLLTILCVYTQVPTHMYTEVHAHLHIGIHMHLHTCTYLLTCACMHMHLHTGTYTVGTRWVEPSWNPRYLSTRTEGIHL